ncbi:MAG: hypothetical protein ACOYBC_00850 [Bilifractor sp.]|jgi:hypothetical protein
MEFETTVTENQFPELIRATWPKQLSLELTGLFELFFVAYMVVGGTVIHIITGAVFMVAIAAWSIGVRKKTMKSGLETWESIAKNGKVRFRYRLRDDAIDVTNVLFHKGGQVSYQQLYRLKLSEHFLIGILRDRTLVIFRREDAESRDLAEFLKEKNPKLRIPLGVRKDKEK